MITAMLRVMLLGFLRDRGALAMAFVLPPMIYMIFAAIFSGTTGDQLRLRVAVLDLAGNETTSRFADAITGNPSFRKSARAPASRADLEAMVRRDEADVGVVLRLDLASSSGAKLSPVLVFGDSAKPMASPIVAGQVQRLFSEKLPDVAYRRTLNDIEQTFVKLTPAQRERVNGILYKIQEEATKLASDDAKSTPAREVATAPLIEQLMLSSSASAGATVVYYAGAVSILFLLFSTMQGAMSLIDERQNGIFDRLMSGASGIGAILGGKFLFLLVQGLIQVGLIFALAAIVYRVDVAARFPEWVAITVAASSAAAGLALLLAAICGTRQQAQTLSSFLVLVLSALGGSMVPRFLMPPWLQDLSWTIPNTWAIEAYHGLLWRNADTNELLLTVGMLLACAVCALLAAWIALWRRRRT